MKKCMVVLNPSSGKERALKYEKLIVEQLADYETVIRHTTGEGDATRFAREACEQKYEAIVLVGGDGTLNEGINGLAEQLNRPIVGVVPLGTVNDFARALEIPLEPEEAIKILGHRTQMADIGKVNDMYFTNIVAIGELASAVGDVSVEQKSQLGSIAYLLEGIKAAAKNESFQIKVVADGATYEEEAMLFVCVLTNSVGSFEKINADADIADGLLHVYIMKSTSVLGVVGMAKNLLTGAAERDEHVIVFETKVVQVEGSSPLQLHVDGDNIGVLPAEISILPRHIEVFSPR